MPYNGSGTFLRVRNWVQDAAANIRIRADRHDSEDDNFASGLSQCITKDGQTTVTANLPMANYRHTGVGEATAATHYARYDQVQLGIAVWADAGGTADAITATYNPATSAPVDGQLFYVRAGAANATTTPTFSPDGSTARTIVKYGNLALAAGDIVGDGHELILRYRTSDTKFELLNPRDQVASTYVQSNVVTSFTAQQNFGTATLTDGVNISWNLNSAQVAKVTLGGNRTLDNPTNMVDGGTYILRVIQDGTGTRTLSYGSAYKWPAGVAPVVAAGANDISVLTFVSDGTNMYGVAQTDFS